MYIPIFINFMRKATDMSFGKRYVAPALGIIGSVFMVIAAIYAHGIQPYQAAAAEGRFACPVLFYLIIFAVVMIVGMAINRKKSK